MQTKKFYLINCDELDVDYITLTDDQFIEEAERQGLVYTQSGFVTGFNQEEFGTMNHVLRIL